MNTPKNSPISLPRMSLIPETTKVSPLIRGGEMIFYRIKTLKTAPIAMLIGTKQYEPLTIAMRSAVL